MRPPRGRVALFGALGSLYGSGARTPLPVTDLLLALRAHKVLLRPPSVNTVAAALGWLHRPPAVVTVLLLTAAADVWLFAADGRDAHPDGGRNLSARHDRMPGSTMNSDVTIGEGARLEASTDGRWLTFTAPIEGSEELWRIGVADGRLERLTEGRQYVSSWDRVAAPRGRTDTYLYLRSSPTETPDLWLLDRPGATPRRISSFNALRVTPACTVASRSSTCTARTLFIWPMSMHTPPRVASTWPSSEVPTPYGMIGVW